MGIALNRFRLRFVTDRLPDPDVILFGPTEPVVALLLSRITSADAKDRGVTVRGEAGDLALRPRGRVRTVLCRNRVSLGRGVAPCRNPARFDTFNKVASSGEVPANWRAR
jgi:hypothetical protein